MEFLLLSSCVLITGKTINVQEVYRNNGAHISQKEPIKGALEETPNIDEQNIAGVKFLVAVNDTWGRCLYEICLDKSKLVIISIDSYGSCGLCTSCQIHFT